MVITIKFFIDQSHSIDMCFRNTTLTQHLQFEKQKDNRTGQGKFCDDKLLFKK